MPSRKELSRFMKNFAERAQLSVSEARRIKVAFVNALKQEVMNAPDPTYTNPRYGEVIIQDLGTFYKGHIKARNVKPPNGEARRVPGHSYLAFKAAKCNRKYESDQLKLEGTFEPVIRYNSDGSTTVNPEITKPGDTLHGDE